MKLLVCRSYFYYGYCYCTWLTHELLVTPTKYTTSTRLQMLLLLLLLLLLLPPTSTS